MPPAFLLIAVAAPCLVGIWIGLGHKTNSDPALATYALIGLGLIVALAFLRHDHELLFGSFTSFTVLTALSAYAAFSSLGDVEDNAAVIFLTLIGLSVAALTLIAHDWARRPFMIAAIIVAAGLSVFIVRVGFESLKVPPQWNRNEIVDRTRATEQFLHAESKKVGTLALDQQICLIAGKPSPSKTSGKCGPSHNTITSNTDWVIDKHQLDIDLARYRFNVTKAGADGTALQKVLEQQPDVDEDISILSAIENGPDTLWRSATHSAGPALVPGPLGWVVLGAIALGLLAWWVKINASQLSGPVVLPDASGSGGDKDLNTVLRVAVLRNLPEPGAAPGAASINPVTNLLDIAGGPLTAVSKTLQTVLAVARRRYGYQIKIDVNTTGPVTAGSAAPPGTTTALIRVIAVSGGTTIRTRLFTSSDPEEAVRSAGLWAAGFILARSTRVPSWAAWNAETADALAVVGDQSSLNVQILEKAVKGAPDSGILLVLLGHYYELAGRDLDALNCYARAVAAHPRYLVARYRLAVTVASLRHRSNLENISLDDLRTLGLAISATKTSVKKEFVTYLAGPGVPAPGASEFASLAETLLKRLAHDMRYRFQVVNSMRRSERGFIWPGLKPAYSTAASHFHQAVKSAHWAVQASPVGKTGIVSAEKKLSPSSSEALGSLLVPEFELNTTIDWSALKKLEKAAKKPHSWWQLSYNAACAYASCVTVNSGKADTALDLLEQTLVHPGIHQLRADWVRQDPDLEPISRSPRFERFVNQLRTGA